MSIFLNNGTPFVNFTPSPEISPPIPTLESIKRIDVRASYKGEISVHSDYIFIENAYMPDCIQVWNKHTLTLERSLELTRGRQTSDQYHIIKVVGNCLWLMSNDGPCGGADLQFWDLSCGHLIKKIHTDCYYAIDDSCLTQTHYQWNKETQKQETQTKIWNPANGELLGSLNNFESGSLGIHPMSLSCVPVFQGDYVVTGHRNGSVHVWNKLDAHWIASLFVEEEEKIKKTVSSLIVCGDIIIWGDKGGVIRSSRVLKEGDIQVYDHPNNDLMHVSELEISDDLLIGGLSGDNNQNRVAVWNKETGDFLYSHEYHKGRFLINGNRLALYKADENVIEIFDKREGSLIVSIPDLPPKCWDFKIFDNLLITPYLDDHLHIRNLETGALLSEIKASPRNFTIDGQQLIAFESKEVADVLFFDLSVFL